MAVLGLYVFRTICDIVWTSKPVTSDRVSRFMRRISVGFTKTGGSTIREGAGTASVSQGQSLAGRENWATNTKRGSLYTAAARQENSDQVYGVADDMQHCVV